MALLNLIEPENIKTEAERTTIRPLAKEYAAEHAPHSISIIVATGKNGEIGVKGKMPWHIPDDLRHFKHITMHHPVIMGRKTWDSLPIKPLPGRRNIVISRHALLLPKGAEGATSLQQALDLTRAEREIFIIGGGEIYQQALPFASRLYLTRIFAECQEADTFFPLPTPDAWMKVEESERNVSLHTPSFTFETWIRTAP